MDKIDRQLVFVLSAVVMAAIAVLTLVAMVIAPTCTYIEQKADAYRVSSICVFAIAYYILIWRKRSLVASIFLPIVQIGMGLLFLRYINSLPMACPR